MITPEESAQLKEIIGHHYTDAVLEILYSKGIRNSHGIPHNAQYVSYVFTGTRNNKDVEAAIWELAARKKAEAKAQEKLKQQILK